MLINIEKTKNMIDELNNNDWVIECLHCNKRFKPTRCMNSLILECPECEISFEIVAIKLGE